MQPVAARGLDRRSRTIGPVNAGSLDPSILLLIPVLWLVGWWVSRHPR